MGSSVRTSTLQFKSWGFELYTPPTSFSSDGRPRFVMLDDMNQVFYDVDYETPALGNTTPWTVLALHTVPDPVIVFPPEQQNMLRLTNFATGILVSVESRTERVVTGKKLGMVNVKPIPQQHMNWSVLKSWKGEELPAEMAAGLFRRVWNRRPGAAATAASIPYVTPNHVLNSMPRPWHRDGIALSHEVDGQFIGGRVTGPPSSWRVYGLDLNQIEKSRTRAAVFIE